MWPQFLSKQCSLKRGTTVSVLQQTHRKFFSTCNNSITICHNYTDTVPSLCVFQVEAEVRRNQLMKDMAQLRLQAEVHQLEGSLQSQDAPHLPPYIIPDASAFCENLQLIKQLANSARFIVIIPLAGRSHQM